MLAEANSKIAHMGSLIDSYEREFGKGGAGSWTEIVKALQDKD